MVHEVVDIARWESVFSLARLRGQGYEFDLAREPITGPYDIAVVEQIRREARPDMSSEESGRVAADVFVFAKGEPDSREVTKIGGLPYWPKHEPWPKTASGRAKTFVAQFCLADSRDIVGDLPGDVLLIFAPRETYDDMDLAAISFEWLRLGESDLVTAGDIPGTDWTITPCYGAIHRTYDYPDAYFGLCQTGRDDIAVIEGTKIGGRPPWIQEKEPLPGRFLCSLGSILERSPGPFPWLNVADPIPSSGPDDEDLLMWGDLGIMYFFIDEADRMHCTGQCY